MLAPEIGGRDGGHIRNRLCRLWGGRGQRALPGAHLNPAVTLAFACGRHFSWKMVPFYWTAQFVSAVAGAALIRGILGSEKALGATVPAGADWESLLLEIVLTFFLMFVIAAVATDTRAVGMMAGIAIGGTVALDALFGGPVSGASMNPARSFGPALVALEFRGLWVYLWARRWAQCPPFLYTVLCTQREWRWPKEGTGVASEEPLHMQWSK
ncbi:Nodulin-26 like Intrinsic Protein [Klebsormidium nitens]|uniref:Nodulin-26 like Intrinsic Protein n=1 Tax=Klebsormidium nitens TaxID=105231 RepID=A0A1Y1I0X8_KLENI|nr:Nodulin-26 like Intrinsic Protein [Klebsormidium nitens]|eukprot:GAQ82426.1 Nodulin-26 like Intrinsic Protein [Klebsormidium nitens]